MESLKLAKLKFHTDVEKKKGEEIKWKISEETLWSIVMGIACFPQQRTTLESPTFAAMIWQGDKITTKAVEPTEYGANDMSLKASSALS